MIENLNAEKLKLFFETSVLPGSSVGLHGIGNWGDPNAMQESLKAMSILYAGLRMSTHHAGLTGTIAFKGQIESLNYDEVLGYAYAVPDNNGNSYTIVCAIPEIVETTNGEKYYLGEYDNFPGLGKDDYKSQSMPTHKLDVLPTEYIVGCIVSNAAKMQKKFIINKNYISFKSEQEQQLFNDDLISKIMEIGTVYSIDEKNYNHVKRLLSFFDSERDSNYYKTLFVDKYEELTKNEIK